MSLLIGRMSVAEATNYVLGDDVDEKRLQSADVRYTTAAAIKKAGFAIAHTPGKIKNGPHVSVIWPADDPLVTQRVPWPPDVASAFNECFNIRGEEQE